MYWNTLERSGLSIFDFDVSLGRASDTPLLNGQNDKSRDQRSGIIQIVREP